MEKFIGVPGEWVVVVRHDGHSSSASRTRPLPAVRSYGSSPALRAATTASPRVWAPSFRIAERR